MPEDHDDDGPEHSWIVQSARIGRGVVGHEVPEEEDVEVLDGEGDPVDIAPRGKLCDNAGEDAGYEDAAEKTGDDDGESGGATMGRGKVAHERKHELGRDCGYCTDVGQGDEHFEFAC